MKKVLAIILCGVLIITLCACTNTQTGDNGTKPTIEQEETVPHVGGNEGSRGESPVRPENSYR